MAGIRPLFTDQILEQLPNIMGQLSSRPQFEHTPDNYVKLINEIMQDGTPMVAGQMNNLLYPKNLITWGNCYIETEEVDRWRSSITVFTDQPPLDEDGDPIPLAPRPPAFNPNIDLGDGVILYEYMAHMPTRGSGYEHDRLFNVVLYRDLDTGAFGGWHYAMIQERKGEADRISARRWRRRTL